MCARRVYWNFGRCRASVAATQEPPSSVALNPIRD
jgi:hypothetical protein